MNAWQRNDIAADAVLAMDRSRLKLCLLVEASRLRLLATIESNLTNHEDLLCFECSNKSTTMTTIVKKKTPITVPPSVQRQAGIKTGDRLEFKVSGGVINIIPELPSADDEYTPAQRRVIDAQLKEGIEDIRKGRTYGPFNTTEEMVASIETNIKKMRVAKRKAKPAR
jgi:bifunctional DNA-binding transcriptional regulator/antitoxin component of YhaV-PrlF toxin-antitoxin module